MTLQAEAVDCLQTAITSLILAADEHVYFLPSELSHRASPLTVPLGPLLPRQRPQHRRRALCPLCPAPLARAPALARLGRDGARNSMASVARGSRGKCPHQSDDERAGAVRRDDGASPAETLCPGLSQPVGSSYYSHGTYYQRYPLGTFRARMRHTRVS